MRRLVPALAVTAGLTVLAAPAHAHGTMGYTPERAALTVSKSTISPGDRFTVSGGGAGPGATVTFTLKRTASALAGDRVVAVGAALARHLTASPPETQHPVSLGSTTDSDGRFSATLTMPAGTEPGVYTLTASSGGGFLAAMTLRVMAANGIGGLPFRGADVLPGLSAGAALILAGGLLLLSLKRRRPAA